jgi:protein-tyrosine kinase
MSTAVDPRTRASAIEPEMAVGQDAGYLADLDLSHVAQRPWNLNLASFPSLDENGADIEQLRALRSHLYQLRYQKSDLKSLVIASGEAGEGRSYIAANLAMSLARNQQDRVLLVDGDLRSSSLHKLLGAPNTPGLAEYLAGKASPLDILQTYCAPGVRELLASRNISSFTFIPAGDYSARSLENMTMERLRDLFSALATHFDWIVIDTPPALAFTDALDFSRAADAVILVARYGRTAMQTATRTKEVFTGRPLLGVVLNSVKVVASASAFRFAKVAAL